MGIDVHIYVKGSRYIDKRKKWNYDGTMNNYYGYFGEGYGSSPWASHIMFEEAFNEDIKYKRTGYGKFSHKKYLFHWKPEVLESRLDKAIKACNKRGTPWKIYQLKNFINVYTMLCKKGFKPWISVSY